MTGAGDGDANRSGQGAGLRIDLVDPPAFSPPYDDALARALAALGADVRLVTSEFIHGTVPEPVGYERELLFYRNARGPAGSKARAFSKLASHGADMRRYRREARDIVHFQWLTVPRTDLRKLPDRPLVLTIHDPLERGGVKPPLRRAAFGRVDAVVVHSEFARERVLATHHLDPDRVHVIPHGAITPAATPGPLPPELPQTDLPVVLCFGLIRPYKGLELLLQAWEGISGAELWVVGRPMMAIERTIASAPPGVRFVPRFVSDAEQAAVYQRADIAVLPYERGDRFGFSGVLATALGAGKAIVLADVGGLAEVAQFGAARLVAAGESAELRSALSELISSPEERAALSAAAIRAAKEVYSWEAAARATLELYETIRVK
jgi:glycosyltransferase involved in cell wall biosynthesis